jgi:hypothetical protein
VGGARGGKEACVIIAKNAEKLTFYGEDLRTGRLILVKNRG